ncbi:MAG: SMI1/KNR4 family protein [Chloroflexia bacterium]
MKETWDRIEKWLVANSPKALAGLNPGCGEDAIEKLEAILGVELPEDFRASYKIHNGQEYDSPWMIGGKELMSLERIEIEWSSMLELLDGGDFDGLKSLAEGPMRNDWWNRAWVPITYDGAGNYFCMDLDPAPGGNRGQLVRFWHDANDRNVIAPSFGDWLRQYADDLEAGVYIGNEGGFVVLKAYAE